MAADPPASARRVSAGIVGGLATGALIGGVGGRLAMFVLRLTSDPSLHGLQTDDGFTIGRFSAETLFLVLATAALGVLGGVVYLAVRPWLPERWRAAPQVCSADRRWRPVHRSSRRRLPAPRTLPLAIAMFVALPAIYGVAMSLLVERLLRSEARAGGSWGWLFGLLPGRVRRRRAPRSRSVAADARRGGSIDWYPTPRASGVRRRSFGSAGWRSSPSPHGASSPWSRTSTRSSSPERARANDRGRRAPSPARASPPVGTRLPGDGR